jgi:hypothetical protein
MLVDHANEQVLSTRMRFRFAIVLLRLGLGDRPASGDGQWGPRGPDAAGTGRRVGQANGLRTSVNRIGVHGRDEGAIKFVKRP